MKNFVRFLVAAGFPSLYQEIQMEGYRKARTEGNPWCVLTNSEGRILMVQLHSDRYRELMGDRREYWCNEFIGKKEECINLLNN